VAAYLARGQMPAPDVKLACGPIWSARRCRLARERDARVDAGRSGCRAGEAHAKILDAIAERDAVPKTGAGASSFTATGRTRSASAAAVVRPSRSTGEEALRQLERVIEQRTDVPAVRRLAAELAEADRLRERIEARSVQRFERALAA